MSADSVGIVRRGPSAALRPPDRGRIHTSLVEHSFVLQPWLVPYTGCGFSLTLTGGSV